MQLVAALLAAGGGARALASGWPTHKLHALRHGRELHRWALDALLEAGVGEVVVITGSADLDLPAEVRRVHNTRWPEGQATSLQLATATAEAAGADALLIGLADQPDIPPEAWRSIAHADAAWPIVVATYDTDDTGPGRRRRGPHPVRITREWWPELPGTGDAGARGLLRRRPELVHEVPCPGSPADIDTLEDLQRWTSS